MQTTGTTSTLLTLDLTFTPLPKDDVDEDDELPFACSFTKS
jgi:hypothetical protein